MIPVVGESDEPGSEDMIVDCRQRMGKEALPVLTNGSHDETSAWLESNSGQLPALMREIDWFLWHVV